MKPFAKWCRTGVLGALLLAGCESVVGGAASRAEVTIFANESVESAVPVGSQEAGGPALQVSHPFEGTVTADLRVLLLAGAFPVTITGGDREVELDLASDDSVALGSFVVGSGIYQGVRLVFTEVTANVTAGLLSGAGVVTVDAGADDLIVIELDDEILLRDGGRLELSVELRSSLWIDSVVGDPAPRVVSEEDFLAAIRVESRTR